jgi:hypothetical protein
MVAGEVSPATIALCATWQPSMNASAAAARALTPARPKLRLSLEIPYI